MKHAHTISWVGGGTVDPWAEDVPVLAGLAAAAVQGRVALGERAGARVHQDGDPLAAAGRHRHHA